MAAAKDKMVTAVFRDRTTAQNAYHWLHSRGHTSNEVSVLMSDATRAKYFPHEDQPIKTGTAAAEGVGIGGAIGTAVGATIAAILTVGTSLAIPGLGLVIAGPIAAALAGAGAGAVTGGVLGGLVGFGIPESNAKAYEEVLREGGVVLGVVPRSGDDADEIKKYFENHKGENVFYG